MKLPIVIVRLRAIQRELKRMADLHERIAVTLERAFPNLELTGGKPEPAEFDRGTPADFTQSRLNELVAEALRTGRDPEEILEGWFPEGGG